MGWSTSKDPSGSLFPKQRSEIRDQIHVPWTRKNSLSFESSFLKLKNRSISIQATSVENVRFSGSLIFLLNCPYISYVIQQKNTQVALPSLDFPLNYMWYRWLLIIWICTQFSTVGFSKGKYCIFYSKTVSWIKNAILTFRKSHCGELCADSNCQQPNISNIIQKKI